MSAKWTVPNEGDKRAIKAVIQQRNPELMDVLRDLHQVMSWQGKAHAFIPFGRVEQEGKSPDEVYTQVRILAMNPRTVHVLQQVIDAGLDVYLTEDAPRCGRCREAVDSCVTPHQDVDGAPVTWWWHRRTGATVCSDNKGNVTPPE